MRSTFNRKRDFYFELPEELITYYPNPVRSASRLLQVTADRSFRDTTFSRIVDYLDPEDLLLLNDSKVIRARLYGFKSSGGRIEILVERIVGRNQLLAQIKGGKSLRIGAELRVGDTGLRLTARRDDLFELDVIGESSSSELLDRHGEVPLPPYIRRKVEASDRERYQTVYAHNPGSVAAPTAGLHFDRALFNALDRRGIEYRMLTLHVGAGTFQPIRASCLDCHQMHAERAVVSREICDAVEACRSRGGRIVAVGSTVVRALETAAAESGRLHPFQGETDVFIRPGYSFRVVDVMITNFHLPESTLFILVCAFAGRQRMLDAYAYAVKQRYRFFSYGDATWLERCDEVHG